MAGEGLADKARRYLGEGRVRVGTRTRGYADVAVRGNLGTYRVVFEDGRWSCTCPAMVPECAHVIAAALIIDPHGRDIAGRHETPADAARRAAADAEATARRPTDPRVRHLRPGDRFHLAGSDRTWTLATDPADAGAGLLLLTMADGRQVRAHGNARVVLVTDQPSPLTRRTPDGP